MLRHKSDFNFRYTLIHAYICIYRDLHLQYILIFTVSGSSIIHCKLFALLFLRKRCWLDLRTPHATLRWLQTFKIPSSGQVGLVNSNFIYEQVKNLHGDAAAVSSWRSSEVRVWRAVGERWREEGLNKEHVHVYVCACDLGIEQFSVLGMQAKLCRLVR